MVRCFIIVVALGLSGCLDPLVDDDQPGIDTGSLLLPAGTEIPSLHDDPALDSQVDENDGVDRLVPLLGAFNAGAHIRYWDFGIAPIAVAPVWVFGTDDGSGGFAKLPDHPVLFDVIPGDTSYTPMWQVYAVFVTDAYDGELITSPAALDEARRRGLVENPAALPMYVNCPVVHKDVLLESDPAGTTTAPTDCYYKGMGCYYFDMPPALTPNEAFEKYPVQNGYLLSREGEEPLNETLRQVDMTEDKDIFDTNDLFEFGTSDEGYTPLVRLVEVVVPTGTSSIDTYQDESQSDVNASSQLFDGTGDSIEPKDSAIVAYEIKTTIYNRPQRLESGRDQ